MAPISAFVFPFLDLGGAVGREGQVRRRRKKRRRRRREQAQKNVPGSNIHIQQ